MLHYLLIASNMQGSAGSNQPGHVNTASVLHSPVGSLLWPALFGLRKCSQAGLGRLWRGDRRTKAYWEGGCCPVTALACLRLCWHLQVTSSAHHHLPLSDQPQW